MKIYFTKLYFWAKDLNKRRYLYLVPGQNNPYWYLNYWCWQSKIIFILLQTIFYSCWICVWGKSWQWGGVSISFVWCCFFCFFFLWGYHTQPWYRGLLWTLLYHVLGLVDFPERPVFFFFWGRQEVYLGLRGWGVLGEWRKRNMWPEYISWEKNKICKKDFKV